jgi:enterochelin esterase-like enzyme
MKKITILSLWALIPLLVSAQLYIKIDASFYSPALDTVKMIDIFLPSDYYVNPEQQYAVIYYLHGGSGNQNSGNTETNLYYALHDDDITITSPPAIFVRPDGSCEPYLGSTYINSALYGNYEDFIMQDVIGFIENNFRAYPDKNFRFITGLSMGGFGSGRLAASYPEMFRASFPYIGFLSMPDTMLNTWKDLYYAEHGNYIPANGGNNTQLLLTMCGGMSPNMGNPPLYVDFPFDTLGNWVDSVLNKWYQFDVSRMVRNLPDENELAWFLGCGTTDYMCTYPGYRVFMDSLDYYGIGYNYRFFNGGHILDGNTWAAGMHWMDSIINYSYHTLGIPDLLKKPLHAIVYPNPVKDIFSVQYYLQESEMVRIDLLDLVGREVALISKGLQNPGEQQNTFDASNLLPGIYLLRIEAGNQVKIVKMIKL